MPKRRIDVIRGMDDLSLANFLAENIYNSCLSDELHEAMTYKEYRNYIFGWLYQPVKGEHYD